jgi:hypothetical protein
MCAYHSNQITRRRFGALFGAVGTVTLLPSVARAAGTAEALALTCIDYRLVDDNVRFLDGLKLTKEYDQISLAGASLAAVSPQFQSSNAAFWDHVVIAKQLHHIRRVIVVDHRDCGAFKVVYGKDFAGAHDPETAQHKSVMKLLQSALAKRHPDLESEFYLMALDGRAERLI